MHIALRTFAVLLLSLVAYATPAFAKNGPEDALKGRIILSDKSLPMSWNSVGAYVAQLKGLNKDTLWYDKKTGKVKIFYGAFFAAPVNDVQVMMRIVDITAGAHSQLVSTEQFMNRGDRVLFNSIELDKEDIPGNKKYLIEMLWRNRPIAQTTVTLRIEGPKYSGKVTFSEDETKAK